MIWYFADDCAAQFPYRHSFQTHYQFPNDLPPNDVGEQPGSRPYNKGHGPIGAPTAGVLWQGDLDSFIHGVPGSQIRSIPPLNCPRFERHGLVALPPPDKFTTEDLAGFANSEFPVAPLSKMRDVPYHFVYDQMPGGAEGTPTHIDWSYSDGGMALSLTVNEGPIGHTVTLQPTFLYLDENEFGWIYRYFWAPRLPLPSDSINVFVGKCIPDA